MVQYYTLSFVEKRFSTEESYVIIRARSGTRFDQILKQYDHVAKKLKNGQWVWRFRGAVWALGWRSVNIPADYKIYEVDCRGC